MQTLKSGLAESSGEVTLTRSLARGPNDAAHRQRLLQEQAMAASLAGVRCVLPPMRYGETPTALELVFRDPGSRPWSTLHRPLGRELGRFLRLAVAVTEAVGELHGARVMHLGLCPDAVRLGAHDDEVYLLGLADASHLQAEAGDARDIMHFPERLPYVAPEQTGRMNRAVDRRADLYALGVMLYEVLTAQLPLHADDALGWVHAHLARRPAHPGRVLPGLPEPISAVLLKLLAKDVEERYRSAVGVLADWRLLLERWEADGELGMLVPGQHDVFDSVRPPERLYGREHELHLLEAAFARAAAGETVAAWVTGEPGIGKSRLIRELERPVTAAGGLFASGKADQLRRHLPFDAIGQSFRGLLRQVLAWPEGRLNTLRAALDTALAANVGVLVPLLPELALLLPDRPAAPVLGGLEAELRFRLIFQRFVETIVESEHALVLTLDDLQWIDPGSLALLETLLSHGEGVSLLVLGSWRDGEVDAGHPVTEMLGRLQAAGHGMEAIRLHPLGRESLGALVRDALGGDAAGPPPEDAVHLADLIFEKTGANPFFVGRFLQGLSDDGHIAFDFPTRRFRIDRGAIAQARLTDNVAEHIARDFSRLSPPVRQVLQTASALGTRFFVDDIAAVRGVSPEDAWSVLFEAATVGFVQRVGTQRGGELQFVHDRLQTAVYESVPEAERSALHLAVGRALLGQDTPEGLGERVFAVAHHYASAIANATLSSPTDRKEAGAILLRAGRRALSGGAADAAVRFLRRAIEMLGPEPFAADYTLALELHVSLAEAERVDRHADEAMRLCDLVDAHAHDIRDRTRTAELRMYLLMNKARIEEATTAAFTVCAALGYPIAPALSMDDLIAHLGQLEGLRANRAPAELAQLPELTDPDAIVVVRLLSAVLPALAITMSPLHVPAFAKVLEIGLTQGVTPFSAYAVAHWAIVAAATGQYGYAYLLGQLTDALRERFADRPTTAGLVEVPMVTQHLVEPVRQSAARLQWGARRSLELGDPTFYGYCANQSLLFAVMAGETIGSLEQHYRRFLAGCTEYQQFLSVPPIQTWGQLAANLRGEHAGKPSVLTGPRFDFDAETTRFLANNDTTSIHYASTAAEWVATIFNDPERVLAITKKFQAANDSPVNGAGYGQHVKAMFRILARLDLSRDLDQNAADLARLQAAAHQNPTNHQHRILLIEAETLGPGGDHAPAMVKFEAAYEHARREHLLHDAALIAERTARFAVGRCGTVITRAWQREAVETYALWGATEKVRLLREEWPETRPQAGRAAASAESSIRTLDLDAVLRAAETLTGERALDRLLVKTMRLVCTAAGAERGVLLLERDDELRVEAKAQDENVEVLQGLPLGQADDVAREIVQYVARTLDTLIVADATQDARFKATAYVATRQPRSVMCAPLVHQGKRIGVLYLENNLTSGAFTTDRVDVLRLLAFQAATSIENAVLYAAAQTQAEELRAKNEALSEVDRLKDELLARTSHELRTPLHGIIGLAQSVVESNTLVDEAARRSLDMIVSSGRRLANLINDILDFQTLKRREIALSTAALSLRDAIDGVLALCAPLVTGRDLVLRNACPEPDLIVEADPDRLAQVLLNLVGNAVKFTRHGEVVVEAVLQGDRVEVRVRDTGIGIAPEQQARIFEGFEQADSRISREFGGAGLGLTVARQLVELHGGVLSVSSELGKGSTFAFSLRQADPARRISRPTQKVRPAITGPVSASRPLEMVGVASEGKGLRVLVVDDEPVNLQVVMNQLSRAGYDVSTALSGPEALEMIGQGLSVDAVLLDVMMPRMDGYEVCAELRKTQAAHTLPIVMLTAKNQVADLVQGLSAGANDYVTKPFTGQELLARLRTHLKLSRVNHAIGRFVPYPFLQLLGRESIVDVKLGDSVGRELTVLFANLRSFTRLSEGMTPEACFQFINTYLGVLEPVVTRHGGFVDKYIGDVIMALFDTADAAVDAGLDMHRALGDFNVGRVAVGREPLRVGIGINAGHLVLGTVGGEHRMDTTVISEAVNLASRLEGMTRRYDTHLLVTEQTLSALRDRSSHSTRMLDSLQIPGRALPLIVHEAYGADPDQIRAAKDATRPSFEQAVRAFHDRKIPEAARLFMLCQTLNPMDAVVRQYVERCQKIQMQFTGLGWDAGS